MKLIIILSFLFFSLLSYANEIDLGEIEVVDYYESNNEKQDEPSAFTTVIPIKNQEHKNLIEILENVGGIIINSTGQDTGIATVSIRGSSSKQVLVMIDGVPINSASEDGVDLSLIPLSSIEKIEVIRGGDSSLHGSYAMGGVINIITKNKKSNYIKTSFFSKLSQMIGGSSNIFASTDKISLIIAVNYLYDKGSFLFYNDNNTIYNENDDFIDIRKNNDVTKQSSLLNLSIYYPKDMKLSFKFNENLKINGVAGAINFPFDDARLHRLLTLGNISFDFGNLSQYFTALILSYYKLNWLEYFTHKENDDKRIETNSTDNVWGIKTNFSLFAIPYHILHFDMYLNGEILKSTLYSNTLSRINFSFGIRDEFLLFNEKIGLLPSIRLDYSNDYGVELSGKAGFYFSPIKSFKLKANAFTSFRNPSFSELYYTYGFIEGNPDLSPEHCYGGDVGFFYNTHGLFIEGVIFVNYFANLIQYILSHGFVYKSINIGNTLSFGAELRLKFQPVSFFKLELNYTLNYLIDIQPDSLNYFIQLPFQPLHTFNFTLEFQPKYFTIGFHAHIESRKHITQTGTKYIPPHGIFDIYLNLHLWSEKTYYSSDFFIEFNNITNTFTYDHRNLPLEGFNIKSGCSFSF